MAASTSALPPSSSPSASTPTPAHSRQPSATTKRRPALGRRPTAESKASHAHATKSKRRSGDFSKTHPSVLAAGADDADMSGGFAHFCATCETQIIVPSSSILYCSESCRRKDCGMSPPHSPAKGPCASSSPAADVDVDIIPPLSPTVRTTPSFYGGAGAAPSTPSQDTKAPAEHRPSVTRKDSEASRYLNQFHSLERPRSLRPRSSRQSAVPSLSHSPSSSASSSVPYTMVKDIARPLPTSRTLVSKSVDLVTPAAAGDVPDSLETLTARAASLNITGAGRGRAYTDEEDVYDDIGYDDAPASYYEKRAYGDAGSATAQSSLKQLLAGRNKG